MGVIQNTLNQGLAAVAVATNKSKENKDKEKADFENEGKNLLKEQVSLAGQADVVNRKAENYKNQIASLNEQSQNPNLSNDDKDKLAYDINIATKALRNVGKQQSAIKKLRAMNTAAIKDYKKRGGKI